ncbi:MAG TPA: pentapeptide repeat-containing protein [Ktedonobacterales bacterium]
MAAEMGAEGGEAGSRAGGSEAAVDSPRPAQDDRDGWRRFWRERGQPWRREPECDAERQIALAERLARSAAVERGDYPFAAIAPSLSRADVEWLLAALDGGCGPVDWDDPAQREREGLDLRGADLGGLDLSGLPLARLRAGLHEEQWRAILTSAQLESAAAHFEHADLSQAHLEGAMLQGAHLEDARLRGAWLAEAELSFALLEGARLNDAHAEGARLLGANLEEAVLAGARLEGAVLSSAALAGAELSAAHMEGARLNAAHLGGARRATATLARLRALDPGTAETLPGADLAGIFFDSTTALDEAVLGDEEHGAVSVADARWGGINLAVVDWTPLRMLGDERTAREPLDANGKPKDTAARLAEFRTAVRASRQLAVALREQGLNEQADLFAYRAQVLQREVLRREALRRPSPGERHACRRRALRAGQYVFSLFLDALAGYGYRPGRSLAAYIASLVLFALAYHLIQPPLGWVGAIALSINSFHGRGFFAGTASPADPVTVLAAVEAIVGLVIEISFIATFTQRFFGR